MFIIQMALHKAKGFITLTFEEKTPIKMYDIFLFSKANYTHSEPKGPLNFFLFLRHSGRSCIIYILILQKSQTNNLKICFFYSD